ncbi:aldehyde dehydrogenase, dimeric NADP-preferring [Polychytrium aggregatum]|uniref:aldehyde dehydrogenase, dimeric NADP-preferring n=1 Tax=Polychytrium aggregatum TaxID=110093 RepID=UPI0022FDCF98|nr:aldehyde dehydrogenase, dimeric NADP-preferring [Polychytrium aggregatum]KAI9209419.1 aldehyde dehydrogenase, dimeric NADP-preferring [Polychytrium aggregatum]
MEFYTPVAQIPAIVNGVRATFASGRTRSREWRMKQLRGCYKLIEENEAEILDNLALDLKKRNRNEATFSELMVSRNAAAIAIRNLDEWMKPRSGNPGNPFIFSTATTKVVPEPLGVVLVISPWNFPWNLSMSPIVSALAAGNAIILKPSEISSHCARLMARLLPQYLDPEAVAVINGGVEETTKLLEQKFDHIIYTGNGHVGKIVMAAASKHLTPVTLELGGKSPAIVTSEADVEIAANRIIWGKTTNCGQVCVAPDYILVERPVAARFKECLVKAIKNLHTSDPKSSGSFGRIINRRQYDRLTSVLAQQLQKNPDSRLLHGGEQDPDDLYIGPTLIENVGLDPASNPIMADEIFGPLLPIIEIDDWNDAVKYINSRDKPLALYVFTPNVKQAESILAQTSSGIFMHNEVLLNFLAENLPFGGVGASGFGRYGGIYGFENFSHMRACVRQPMALEHVWQFRYAAFMKDSPSTSKVMHRIGSLSVPGFGARLAQLLRRYVNWKTTVAAGLIVAAWLLGRYTRP